jgi:hypothetical protein
VHLSNLCYIIGKTESRETIINSVVGIKEIEESSQGFFLVFALNWANQATISPYLLIIPDVKTFPAISLILQYLAGQTRTLPETRLSY